ncbi:MAG: hypothetical protein LBG06_01305 [Deltaproteobacteria bacterium]|jgi:hypothetical protein|nr:hypothetical protein [Deltaproteobacteria bacterium]
MAETGWLDEWEGGGAEGSAPALPAAGLPLAEMVRAHEGALNGWLADARATIRERFAGEVEALRSLAAGIEVRDAAGMDAALGLSVRIDGVLKAVERQRKDVVGPPNAYVKAVNAAVKAITEPLDGILRGLKVKMADHQREAYLAEQARLREEQARREAALKAEREAWERSQAELQKSDPAAVPEPMPAILAAGAPPEPSKTVRGESGRLTLVETWTFAVEDPALVPREFLAVDERAVRDAVKAGVREIPGVRIYAEMTPRLGR